MLRRFAREVETGDSVFVPFIGWRAVVDVLPEAELIRLDFVGGACWRLRPFDRVQVLA